MPVPTPEDLLKDDKFVAEIDALDSVALGTVNKDGDKAMDLIVHHGGRKVTSVSSKTTHLLAGEGAGSKMEKALELGVKVVSEEEFMKILKKDGIKV